MDVEPPPTPFFFQVHILMLLRNRYIGVTGSEMCKSIEINGVTYIRHDIYISFQKRVNYYFSIFYSKKSVPRYKCICPHKQRRYVPKFL